ncbi:hypothetical protein NXV05_21075 [Parabacteroides johnsonii]|nr:hypothetical protein [Parabacteroides johnsonii]
MNDLVLIIKEKERFPSTRIIRQKSSR